MNSMSYEFRVMMCQCRFVDCNRCTTLVVGELIVVEMCMCGTGVNGNSLPSAQFSCEPKPAPKTEYPQKYNLCFIH
jgi:hypothetical protein